MDLDKLKDTWQSAEIKSSIDEDKIQQMLDNKGKSAFNKLLSYERRGFKAIIGFFILFLIILIVDKEIVPYILFYELSIIPASIWQWNKISFLKKIDVANMDILEVSTYINRFKKKIYKEWAVAIVWLFAFCAIFLARRNNIFFNNDLEFTKESITLLIRNLIIMSAAMIGLTYIIYKLTMGKYIKTIEKAITEVEEFKKDNVQ